MTAPNPTSLELNTVRHLAAFAGLSLTEQRLAELRPAVETAWRNAARLVGPELHDVEPTVAAPPLDQGAAGG